MPKTGFSIASDLMEPSMAKRVSVYVGPPTQQVLEIAGPPDEPTASARIAEICETYLAILDDARPQLERAEWLALCDALYDYGISDWPSARTAWLKIEDAED